jgi:sugar phosphate isomerase/epimerase
MRLGLGSYACAWAVGVPGYQHPGGLDGAGLIDLARELGVRVVQIDDNIPIEQQSSEQIQRIGRAATDAGIEIELGTRGVALSHLRNFLQLSRQLDSHLLRVVVDTATHQPSPGEIVETMRLLAPEIIDAGVVLGIENHGRLEASVLAEIVDRISSPAVGICLDTTNSFGALEGPGWVVQTLGPYAVNLHLKDFIIRREPHMMGFRIAGAPVGQGLLDVPWVLDQLRRFRRDVNVILELWPPPEPDVAATIAKESLWRASSVRYLRTLIPD